MSYELGLDRSGNGNNWTVTNMTLAADQMVDSPTNNFATLNPIDNFNGTFGEGNLYINISAFNTAFSTIGMSSGKWYWEALCIDQDQSFVGIGHETLANVVDPGTNVPGYVWHGSNGNKYTHGTGASYNSGATYTDDDIIGVAFDRDNGTLTYYKNGSSQGEAFTGLTSGIYFAILASGSGGANPEFKINFGQDSSFSGSKTAQGNQDSNGIGDFYYTPPTDYLALCTSNLPAVAVTPSEHFNTVLYTGDGSEQAITGVGFQPDFIWIKSRSHAKSNLNVDAIRGTSGFLASDNTMAEATEAHITAIGSDGFTVDDVDSGTANENTYTYVAWNWKANGSGSSNTDGSITSTVSANVDAGFSIATWTGTSGLGTDTIGHGLSQAPEMIISKISNAGDNWYVYHKDLTSGYGLFLNTTDAQSSGRWGTAPTSTLFTEPSDSTNVWEHVTYCFHSVEGYSKMGIYTGNGSTDGTFVYTGFRPAFLLMKITTGESNWHIMDSARDVDNPIQFPIDPNLSNAEYSAADRFDFLSNGFKLRHTSGSFNSDGGTFIYMAFAETPFKYSNAR